MLHVPSPWQPRFPLAGKQKSCQITIIVGDAKDTKGAHGSSLTLLTPGLAHSRHVRSLSGSDCSRSFYIPRSQSSGLGCHDVCTVICHRTVSQPIYRLLYRLLSKHASRLVVCINSNLARWQGAVEGASALGIDETTALTLYTNSRTEKAYAETHGMPGPRKEGPCHLRIIALHATDTTNPSSVRYYCSRLV